MINKLDKDDDRESIIKKLNLIREKGTLSEKSKTLLGYGLKNLHLYYKPDLGKMKGNTTLLPLVTKNLYFLDMNKNSDNFQLKLSKDLIPLADKLFIKIGKTLSEELGHLVILVQKEYIENPSTNEGEMLEI